LGWRTGVDGVDVREVSAAELRTLIPMPDAISAVRAAFVLSSQGRCDQPMRIGLRDSSLLAMAAKVDGGHGSTVKIVTITAENSHRGLPTIQGLVLWFDSETGSPQLLLEGAAVTALRTGAASGAATDLLARRDASVLAMIGAGAQAMDQVMAVMSVRRITEVRVTSRSSASRDTFCGRLAEVLESGITIQSMVDPNAAVEGADVICCATPSTAPLFDGSRVGSGAHINAIGSFTPTMRELPPDVLARATVIAVDKIEAAMEEAGDLLQAIESGHITQDRLVELGTLLARGSLDVENGPTVFKSVGIGAQDWAIADLVRSRTIGSSAIEVARQHASSEA
jgi:ornithine cyclodeaminase/alanine dehydrogenase-like protein (mu-crystallin family)